MKQLKAPNGKRIIGTAEIVNATAITAGFSDKGDPVYAGGSEVDWDSQFTRIHSDGSILVVDEDGEFHSLASCTLADE